MSTNNAWNKSNIIGVPNGATGLSSLTAYGILLSGTTTTGNFQQPSGIGSSTNILKSAGSSAVPVWASNPGTAGKMILLSTLTASASSSINFTSVISSTYVHYMVIYTDVQQSDVSTARNLQMNFSVDNGSNWLSSNYQSGLFESVYSQNTITNTSSTATCLIGRLNSNTNTPFIRGTIYLYNLDVSVPPMYTGQAFLQNSTPAYNQMRSFGYNSTTSSVNAIQFLFSSGNITSGSFSLYGLAKT